MDIIIKKFDKTQYSMIKEWWNAYKEQAPELDVMPETSYIMFIDNKPILSVSLFLTNGVIAWIDNYIGNPELKGSVRKECGHILLTYLEDVAKSAGKNRMFCMSMNEKTSKRYIELGFNKTCENITTFVKEIA